MATRRSFLAMLGIGLFSAAAAWADPPRVVSAPVPASDAVNTVRQYLAFRATNELTKAYALLSRTTQSELHFDQFAQVKAVPVSPSSDGMTPILRAVSALFIDAGNTLGYRFLVVGIAPEDAHTVLVSAQPLQAGADKSAQPLLLRIVTAPDPQTRVPHIDMLASLLKTDRAGFEKARERARQISSLSNLKQMSLAMLQYTQDYDEHYPPAAKWVDAITPYLTADLHTHEERQRVVDSVFHDPSAPASQKWSYAFNSNLSGLKTSQVDSPATTVLLFESNAGVKNASDTGESIPRPGRHNGGTDYGFADGHCDWVSDTPRDAIYRTPLSFSPTGN